MLNGLQYGLSNATGKDMPNRNNIYTVDLDGFVDRDKKKLWRYMAAAYEAERTPTTTTIGTQAGSAQYTGAKFVPRAGRFGDVYCIPRTSSQVAVINTQTDVVTKFGSFGATANKWVDGFLFKNKIYCAPFANDSVLIIDTDNDTTREVSIPNKFADGTAKVLNLHWNGLAYTRPLTDGTVYVFDPRSETLDLITLNGQRTLSETNGRTFLASDGCFYAAPYTGRFIHKYNPINNLLELIDMGSTSANDRWSGAAMENNNRCIYWAPTNAGTMLKYNLNTGVASTFGATGGTGVNKWLGASLDLNGYIYFFIGTAGKILRLDPSTDTLSDYITGLSTALRWSGHALSDNGCYYQPCYNSDVGNDFLKVGVNRRENLNPNFCNNIF